LGRRETATVVLLLSVAAVWSTLQSRGPFTDGPPNESLLLLDLFLFVSSCTGMAVAAVVHERKIAAEALEAASKAKDQYPAILGHELRSPPSSISHAAAALEEPA
jgi:signal transduction histidine kinase